MSGRVQQETDGPGTKGTGQPSRAGLFTEMQAGLRARNKAWVVPGWGPVGDNASLRSRARGTKELEFHLHQESSG